MRGDVGTRIRGGALVLLMAMLMAAPAHLAAADDVLVIGRITDHPERHAQPLRDLADYLVRRTRSEGLRSAEVVMVPRRQAMIAKLADGAVDLVSETPFGVVELVEAGVADPLLREWRKGAPRYSTVFFTRRDATGIEDLADLKGRVVAFEDPGSTSAFLVPYAALRRAGLRPARLDSPRDPVPPGTVGYAFAGDEQSISAWVARGLADAGAFSDSDWRNEEDVPRAMRRSLRIFHRTEPVIRSLMVVRRDLPAARRRALAAALLNAHEDAEGRRVLAAASGVTRYEPLGPAAMAELRAAAALRRYLPQPERALP